MKVWGITPEQAREAAAAVGVSIHGDYLGTGISRDGRGIRFRIGVDATQPRNANGDLPYQRISMNHYMRQRRIAAVCWHGHRDYMRAVFDINPDARIQTALADYHGRDEFERTHADTYGTGNDWNLSYGQACRCNHNHKRRAAA